MSPYRVELECGVVTFQGTRAKCIAFILRRGNYAQDILVNARTGRAESWVA